MPLVYMLACELYKNLYLHMYAIICFLDVCVCVRVYCTIAYFWGVSCLTVINIFTLHPPPPPRRIGIVSPICVAVRPFPFSDDISETVSLDCFHSALTPIP